MPTKATLDDVLAELTRLRKAMKDSRSDLFRVSDTPLVCFNTLKEFHKDPAGPNLYKRGKAICGSVKELEDYFKRNPLARKLANKEKKEKKQ